jgi:hypothetical protein
MIRITLFFASVLLVQIMSAQPVITYNNHALLPGMNNPMTLCKYSSPGDAGYNITWDFSKLETLEKFVGSVNRVVADNNFYTANVELEEFGTSFFFQSDENSIQQVGYTSQDEKTVIQYSQPYEKMVFPLSIGDLRNCTFSGNYTFEGSEFGNITGTGTIEADAWGTIILPNNSIYENTIRVKSVKTYTTVFYNSKVEQEVEVVTYRWYNNYHRYPLLVLTEYITKNGSSTRTNYQSAYNNNAVSGFNSPSVISGSENIGLFPNPAQTDLSLFLFSATDKKVQIVINDVSGRNVLTISNLNVVTGENIIPLSNEISSFKSGTYMLNVISDANIESREFILTK